MANKSWAEISNEEISRERYLRDLELPKRITEGLIELSSASDVPFLGVNVHDIEGKTNGRAESMTKFMTQSSFHDYVPVPINETLDAWVDEDAEMFYEKNERGTQLLTDAFGYQGQTLYGDIWITRRGENGQVLPLTERDVETLCTTHAPESSPRDFYYWVPPEVRGMTLDEAIAKAEQKSQGVNTAPPGYSVMVNPNASRTKGKGFTSSPTPTTDNTISRGTDAGLGD